MWELRVRDLASTINHRALGPIKEMDKDFHCSWLWRDWEKLLPSVACSLLIRGSWNRLPPPGTPAPPPHFRSSDSVFPYTVHMSLCKLWETVKNRRAWCTAVREVAEVDMTELWTTKGHRQETTAKGSDIYWVLTIYIYIHGTVLGILHMPSLFWW